MRMKIVCELYGDPQFFRKQMALMSIVNSHLAPGFKTTGQKESTRPWERQEKDEPELQYV